MARFCFLFGILLGVLLGSAAIGRPDEPRRRFIGSPADQRVTDPELPEREFHDLLRRLKGAPLYYRLSLAECALDVIESPEGYKAKGESAPEAGRHSLRLGAGRAAAAIESLLGLELPFQIREGVGEEQREHIVASARKCVGLFRRATTLQGVGLTTDEATKRFGGKIRPGEIARDATFTDRCRKFEEMVESWYPIGKSIAELEKLVGEPAQRESEERLRTIEQFVGKRQADRLRRVCGYSFGNGFATVHYRIRTDDNKRIIAILK